MQIGASEATVHRTESSLRKPVFNWNANDKYMMFKILEMEVANIL